MGESITNKTDGMKRGLMGMFPSRESFEQFEQEDAELASDAIPQIVRWAYTQQLIPVESRDALVKLIANSSDKTPASPSEKQSFESIISMFLTNPEKDTKLTVNRLVEKLNGLASQFGLPIVQASMITRLKQRFVPSTPRKRATLRLLAYWAAENRPQLKWNYERFFQTTRQLSDEQNMENPDEGVVIAFNIQGQGALVEAMAVDWVKNELCSYLEELHFPKKQIEAGGVTSVRLKLPRQSGPAWEPRLYAKAMIASIALAHQMSVRWLLLSEYMPAYILRIAIYAGQFSEADVILHRILEEPLPAETMVVLTDFAHLCAEIVDIKVVFKRPAHQIELRRGTMIDVWLVDFFFTIPYFDIVPQLLEEKMLPITSGEYKKFRDALYHLANGHTSEFKILERLHRSPQHSLLALEVVKVLIARRMFPEADKILSNIFILYPRHVLARMIRMHIYTCLAAEHPEFSTSEQFFARALAEGELLTNDCDDQPEVWCAYGAIYFERALKYFARLRRKLAAHEAITKQDVFDNLTYAVEQFLKGVTICPTGKDTRSLFLIVVAQSFLELFQTDDTAFTSKKIQDTGHVFQSVAIRFFSMIGLLRETIARLGSPDSIDLDTLRRQLSDDEHREVLDSIEKEMANLYHNTVLMQTFVPNILHATCCFLWDFMPRLTVGLCKRIIYGLEKAREEAEKLRAHKLGIYSAVRFFDYRPEGFVACMNTLLDIVNHTIPPEELQRDDNTFLNDATMEHVSRVKLMLARIDHDIHPGVLLRDT